MESHRRARRRLLVAAVDAAARRRRAARRRCSGGVEGVGRCGGAGRHGRARPAPRRSPGLPRGALPRGVSAVRAVRRVGYGGGGVHQPRHAGAGRSSRVAADRRAAPRRDAARGRARRRHRRAGARLAARALAMGRRDGDCRRPDACGDRDSPLGDVSRARAQHLLRESRGRRRWTREARPGVRRQLDARARGGRRLSGHWRRRREARRRSPRIDLPRALRRVHPLYGERGRRSADGIPRSGANSSTWPRPGCSWR